MKKNKILAGVLVTSILVTGLGIVSADFGDFSKIKFNHMNELTDEQKTEIENMTQEERKDFFESKRSEMEIKKEAREKVIDKLLAGETLTADEEELRAEVIEQRAERKANMEVKQIEREEMKKIIEKKKAGEELTDEEQVKLDDMKGKRGGKKGGKRGNGGKSRGFER